MSTKEKADNYREAVRYMENASEILRTKAKKDDGYYQDRKYVKMASGTAYYAVLLAMETYLASKGKAIVKPRKGRIDVDDYRRRVGTIDKKMLDLFNTTYNVLHLAGYYDGELSAGVIREGMIAATEIINKIRPAGLAGIKVR